MRHFLFFALIIALAVPPLFGNVIVKRQTTDEGRKCTIRGRGAKVIPKSYMFLPRSDAETTPKPFSNDGFLEEGPFDSPQQLINTVGGLVRGVFDAIRRVASTARDVSSPHKVLRPCRQLT